MNLKQLMIIDIKGVIWKFRHPIILICSYLHSKGLEHIQDKWFDCPSAFLTNNVRKRVIKRFFKSL